MGLTYLQLIDDLSVTSCRTLELNLSCCVLQVESLPCVSNLFPHYELNIGPSVVTCAFSLNIFLSK